MQNQMCYRSSIHRMIPSHQDYGPSQVPPTAAVSHALPISCGVSLIPSSVQTPLLPWPSISVFMSIPPPTSPTLWTWTLPIGTVYQEWRTASYIILPLSRLDVTDRNFLSTCTPRSSILRSISYLALCPLFLPSAASTLLVASFQWASPPLDRSLNPSLLEACLRTSAWADAKADPSVPKPSCSLSSSFPILSIYSLILSMELTPALNSLYLNYLTIPSASYIYIYIYLTSDSDLSLALPLSL